ncbi:MAG: hypothetical protein ACPGYT_12330 [Nitrospirales bacterium]
MNSQHCPQCGKESFASTGAFWSCSSCRIAITSQALSKESGHKKFPPGLRGK